MSLHIAMLIAGTIPICGYWILQKLYGDGIETRWKIYILRLSMISVSISKIKESFAL